MLRLRREEEVEQYQQQPSRNSHLGLDHALAHLRDADAVRGPQHLHTLPRNGARLDGLHLLLDRLCGGVVEEGDK
jgi:hypothetical protein